MLGKESLYDKGLAGKGPLTIDTTYIMLQKWPKSMHIEYTKKITLQVRKEQRKIRKRALIKKEDPFQHLESVQYQLQAFYEIGGQGTSGGKCRGKGRGDT